MSQSKLNPAKWPINNKNVIYLFTILLLFFGYKQYNSIPKENFPEIKFPQIIIQTIYPGTSPENMETLVTKPIEDELKSLSGLKKMNSTSLQDFSVIIAEFRTDVDVDKAKQDVKEAVDKAKNDLPTDLTNEPTVKEIDVSEFPILYVNVSGNYSFEKLKLYADLLQDEIESFKEIRRVDIIGAPEREVRIEPDLFKMQSASLSFLDIAMAMQSENINATAGTVDINNQKRQISIKKGFTDVEQIKNTIISSPQGAHIPLKDIAKVTNGFEKQESFARLYGKNVITLNVIKAGGENLIEATDKINARIAELKKANFPKDLKITVTGDQSEQTRTTLHDLINTIVIGFLLVTIILMFFMGIDNAIFVALSVPLSCALAFLVFPVIGFTLNMIVLFAFLLALGIVVDDAIVVVENTHRIFENGKIPIKEATLKATQEVFIPVFAGTATTLMPFVPLAFWQGNIGEFMFFLPITLIITLFASLIVAYIINPVFAIDFMKPHKINENNKIKWSKRETILSMVFVVLAISFYGTDHTGLANLTLFVLLLVLLRKFILDNVIKNFQEVHWPAVINWYERVLRYCLNHAWWVVLATFVLTILTAVAIWIREPKVVFFPEGAPNFAYVYLNLPVGVDQNYTNKVLAGMEEKIYKELKIDPKTGKDPKGMVRSIISNVTVGATDPEGTEIGNFPNKGKITVSFVKFADRNGKSSGDLLEKIRACLSDIPGAQITVTKESSGPPVPKPIVIEITGADLKDLAQTSRELVRYLNNKSISGIEDLRSDFEENKPELVFNYDRERMNREGISTNDVARTLRFAVFGAEVSRFRDLDEDYPINIRLNDEQGQNVDVLKNINITYRDMAKGGIIRQVPLSSFVDFKYQNTYGSIKRKDGSRIITISSGVFQNYNANEVVEKVQSEINSFSTPKGITIKMGGEQEEQKETMSFLGNAFVIAFGLMFVIIMMLFNSYRRTIIIMSEIILGIIGVLLGIAITGMQVSIVMTGIGIIALGGIVVRNGILLVEYADNHLKEGMSPYDSFIEAGKARMTPVVLTAFATILGLIPLAVGLNIDFVTLFTELNPKLYFGGDSVAFWGPLSWTMIFGLAFGTILTLILVPVLMLLSLELGKKWFNKDYI